MPNTCQNREPTINLQFSKTHPIHQCQKFRHPMSKILTHPGSFPPDFPLRKASRTGNAPSHCGPIHCINRNPTKHNPDRRVVLLFSTSTPFATTNSRTTSTEGRRKVTPIRQLPLHPHPILVPRSTQNSRSAFPIGSRPTALICRIFLRRATPIALCRPSYSEYTTQIALFSHNADRPIPRDLFQPTENITSVWRNRHFRHTAGRKLRHVFYLCPLRVETRRTT